MFNLYNGFKTILPIISYYFLVYRDLEKIFKKKTNLLLWSGIEDQAFSSIAHMTLLRSRNFKSVDDLFFMLRRGLHTEVFLCFSLGSRSSFDILMNILSDRLILVWRFLLLMNIVMLLIAHFYYFLKNWLEYSRFGFII